MPYEFFPLPTIEESPTSSTTTVSAAGSPFQRPTLRMQGTDPFLNTIDYIPFTFESEEGSGTAAIAPSLSSPLKSPIFFPPRSSRPLNSPLWESSKVVRKEDPQEAPAMVPNSRSLKREHEALDPNMEIQPARTESQSLVQLPYSPTSSDGRLRYISEWISSHHMTESDSAQEADRPSKIQRQGYQTMAPKEAQFEAIEVSTSCDSHLDLPIDKKISEFQEAEPCTPSDQISSLFFTAQNTSDLFENLFITLDLSSRDPAVRRLKRSLDDIVLDFGQKIQTFIELSVEAGQQSDEEVKASCGQLFENCVPEIPTTEREDSCSDCDCTTISSSSITTPVHEQGYQWSSSFDQSRLRITGERTTHLGREFRVEYKESWVGETQMLEAYRAIQAWETSNIGTM